MKKIQILLFIFCCTSSIVNNARAQCNPAIPNNATVVNFTQQLGGGGMTCWICSGDTLTMNGGSGTMYLEPGAYMDGGGGSHTIWVPPGAHLNVPGTGSQTVYYVCPESLIDPGNSPTLIQCTAIHYDYSNAPPNGCSQLSTTAVCPALPNFAASDSIFCSGSGVCIDFYDSSLNSPVSWQWFFPGAVPNTSSLQNPTQICYNNPGSYFVMLVVNGTDTLIRNNYITVFPAPPPQGIQQSGDTLFANAGAGNYQWYYSGNSIAGATDYFYVAQYNGDYNVVVTDSNGCEVEAAIFDVVAGLTPTLSKGEGVTAAPNPVSDKLILTGFQFNKKNVSVRIYNMIGEVALAVSPLSFGEVSNGDSTGRGQGGEVNVSQLPSGMYWIEISSAEKILRTKFLKLNSR